MKKDKVRIGDLNFELSVLDPGEVRELEEGEEFPMLEIENDASMIYLKVSLSEAKALRTLLDKYLSLGS